MKPRFFYLIPSIGWGRFNGETAWNYLKRLATGNHQPSGGIQVIYQHCDILNRNGFEAFPVNLGASWNSFQADWFSHKSEPISARQARKLIAETDLVICPEVIPNEVKNFPVGQKILFVQNWGLVKGTDLDPLFTEILTVSPFCMEFMRTRSNLPISLVTNGIDLHLFHPAPEMRVPNRVLFWGRKNRNDGLLAIKIIPQIQQRAEFVEAQNNLTQTGIAALYQQADIFMALGYPEGFALPPLEAMACGCVVIGFTGGGGRVHMINSKTALVVEDGNREELAGILELILNDSELKERIRTEGLSKSREFTPQRMEQELLEFALKFNWKKKKEWNIFL